jgi:hypothetical protein
MMKRSGIAAVSYRSEQDGIIRYIIEIPTPAAEGKPASDSVPRSQLTAI